MRWWMLVLALLLGAALVAAVLGVEYNDRIEDIPVPADGTGCAIGEDVLPKPPYGSMLPVEVETDWNTSSVWVGVVSAQERDRLIAASTLGSEVVVDCSPDSIDFAAGGPNAQSETSFTWTLEEDDHYPITGEYGLVDDGSGGLLDGVIGEDGPLVTYIDVDVEAHAAAGPVLLIALGGAEAITVLAGFAFAMRRKK